MSPTKPNRGSYILVMDPAAHTPELGCFNNIVELSATPAQYFLPALTKMQHADELSDDLAGVIVLGSAASANDQDAWQADLRRWLERVIDNKIPLLGLCYGHQLIAHMLGGTVDFIYPDKHKKQGLVEVQVDAIARWGSPAQKGPLVISHREAVVKAPDSMREMARSAELPNYGLEHKTLPIWTFQPHPEAISSFLGHVGISSSYDKRDFAFGHSLVSHFLNYCYQ